MITSLGLLALIVGTVTLVYLYTKLPQRGKVGVAAVVLLTAFTTAIASPAWAAAVNDNALSEGQKALNETLKSTPQDNQYQGIEYPQVTGEALSDREITQRIQREIPDHLKVSVSSGAVRVSGKVNNRNEAQGVVQDIKEVPGVHEVSYDLGIN